MSFSSKLFKKYISSANVVNSTMMTIYTQQKKLRKSQKNMQHKNIKANTHSFFIFCLDTCHRLRKMFTLVAQCQVTQGSKSFFAKKDYREFPHKHMKNM